MALIYCQVPAEYGNYRPGINNIDPDSSGSILPVSLQGRTCCPIPLRDGTVDYFQVAAVFKTIEEFLERSIVLKPAVIVQMLSPGRRARPNDPQANLLLQALILSSMHARLSHPRPFAAALLPLLFPLSLHHHLCPLPRCLLHRRIRRSRALSRFLAALCRCLVPPLLPRCLLHRRPRRSRALPRSLLHRRPGFVSLSTPCTSRSSFSGLPSGCMI